MSLFAFTRHNHLPGLKMEGKASAPLAAGRGNTAWMFYWQKRELTPVQTQGVEIGWENRKQELRQVQSLVASVSSVLHPALRVLSVSCPSAHECPNTWRHSDPGTRIPLLTVQLLCSVEEHIYDGRHWSFCDSARRK